MLIIQFEHEPIRYKTDGSKHVLYAAWVAGGSATAMFYSQLSSYIPVNFVSCIIIKMHSVIGCRWMRGYPRIADSLPHFHFS